MHLFERLGITCILSNCPLSFLKHSIIFLKLLECRYLFNLRKNVKNKEQIEGLICEAYIVTKISTFTSYFFSLI